MGKQRQVEEQANAKEIMEHRREMDEAAKAYAAEEVRVRQGVELQESREYQEYKRDAKAADHQQEGQIATEGYCETKNHSEWQVETQKILLAERQRPVVEELLEHHQFVREYKQYQVELERDEQQEVLQMAKQLELDHEIAAARRERDTALQS